MKRPNLIAFNLKSEQSSLKKSKPKVAQFLFLAFAIISFSTISFAQADDVRRLQSNISSLKSKIRESQAKDPKDIQRLYKLENELEKKMYLQKNRAR